MSCRPLIAALFFASLTFASRASADGTLSYQGRITDAQGAGIPSAELTAHVFDTAAATTPAVTLGPFTNVVFRDGVFSLSLGFTESQLDTLFGAGKRAHIQIVAKLPNGSALSLPRQELGATPLALRVPVGAGLRFDGDGKLVVDLDDAAIPAGIARDGEIPSLLAPGAIGETAASTVKATELRLPDADGTVVTVKANAATPSNYTLTLPVNDGNNGNLLITDGNGNLSWVAPGGGGDMFAATYDGAGGSQAGVVDNSERLNGRDEAFLRDASNLNAGQIADARIPAGIARDAEIPAALPPNGAAGGALGGTYPNPTLADNTVTTAKLVNGTILDEDIAVSGITTAGKVSGSAITSGTIGGTTTVATSGAIGTSGGVTLNGTAAGSTELRFREDTDDGVNYVALKAPATLAGDLTWTLPDAAGTPGQVLSVTAGGLLSWANSAADTNAQTICPDGTYLRGDTATTCRTAAQVVGDGGGVLTSDTGAVSATMLADNAVTNAKLADNAVTTLELADNAVTNGKMADNAIGNAELADNAVTTAELADNAVTNGKMADNAIGNAELADNAVGTAELADDAVTSAELADNAVTGTHIDPTTSVTVATATANATLRIREGGGSPTDFTIFQGAAQSGDITYTLPGAVPGGNGYLLSSTTGGVLSWAAPPSTGVPGIASTADANAITIDASERVGIGTTSPDERLDVEGGDVRIWNNFDAKVHLGNAGMIRYANSSDILHVGAADNFRHVALGNASSGTAALFIDRMTDGGNVGIGTMSPVAKLDIKTGSATTPGLSIEAAASQTADLLIFANSAAAAMGQITSDGRLHVGGNGGYSATRPAALSIYKSSPTVSDPHIRFSLSGDTTQDVRLWGTAGGSTLNTSGNVVAGFGLYLRGSTANGFDANTSGNYLQVMTASTERMRIDSAGNVGIGTTNPQAKLDVAGIVRATELCDESGSNCKDISSGWGGGSPAYGAHGSASADSLYVDATNQVGIRTTSPQGLQINTASLTLSETTRGVQNVRITNGPRILLDNGSSVWEMDNSGGAFRIFTPGIHRFMIDATGRVGILTPSPEADFSFLSGNRTLQIDRAAVGAGSEFTLRGGGAQTGASNTNGGTIVLSSGISTGSGSSSIELRTAAASGTGTADNTPTTKMTVLGNGNVGIGTTGPSSPLSVVGPAATNFVARFEAGNPGSFAGIVVANAAANNTANRSIVDWRVNSTTQERTAFRIDAGLGVTTDATRASQVEFNGNVNGTFATIMAFAGSDVAIGSTTPAARLDVNGDVRAGYKGDNTGATISFTTGNTQVTSVANGPLVLNDMEDGGYYTLILTAGNTNAYALTGSGISTWRCSPACPSDQVTGTSTKHTVVTILKAGTVGYVMWTAGL